MDTLTLQALNEIVPGAVFAQGMISNSPEGIYMSSSNVGKTLVWVAKKGYANDWSIYVHWAEHGPDYAELYGDKVMEKKNIQKLVPCDDDAYKMYRF